MQMILAIAGGGALGALTRHFWTGAIIRVLGTSFPWGVLTANILGSFCMGALVAFFAHSTDMSQAFKAFLTVGFLGAFTTFSAFSLDSINLIERGDYLSAGYYILGSVFCSITALFIGMICVRQVIS